MRRHLHERRGVFDDRLPLRRARAASAAWSVSNHSSNSAVVVALLRRAALSERSGAGDLADGPELRREREDTRFGLNLVRVRSAWAGGY
jgi:hypothetical protein